MSQDEQSLRAASSVGPATRLRAVVPSDGMDLPGGLTRCLYVGEAGAVEVVDESGVRTRLLSAAHQYHPIRVRRVLATGTDADAILAMY